MTYDINDALIDLWESQAGSECAHGIGIEDCPEPDCACNPIRPFLRAAYAAKYPNVVHDQGERDV